MAEVVTDFYAALGQADIEAAMACLDAEIELKASVPASDPLGGTYKGHEGARKYLATQVQRVETKSINLYDFVTQGEKVVVLGHEKSVATNTGKEYSYDFVHVYTVVNGKIISAKLFFDSATYVAANQQ